MFILSQKYNPNYLAQIVMIGNVQPVPNSDNLVMTMVQGNTVVTGKGVNQGDIMVYFPVECQLSDWYLKKNNLYRDSTLNEDPTQKGFFELNGRVRCIKLRQQPSMGLLMPMSSFNSGSDLDIDKDLIGKEFDTFKNDLLVKKYIPKYTRTPEQPNSKAGKKAKEKAYSKVIENQFRFHIDTPQFGKNFHRFRPTDIIQITGKMHGTSGISSYVKCKTKPNRINNIVAALTNWTYNAVVNLFSKSYYAAEPVNEDYDYIYSSRRVIKNDYKKAESGYYKSDIWEFAHNVVKPALKKGMTMYYEILGYLPTAEYIQKGFDYGCTKPQLFSTYYEHGIHYKVMVYRITMTNDDGDVYEFSAKQVQEYCQHNMLTAVPEYFYGKAEDILAQKLDMSLDIWQEMFLQKLKDLFLEKDCSFCKNNVPDEGVVIRKDGLLLDVYKLKSFRFLKKETEELDTDDFNIEDNDI